MESRGGISGVGLAIATGGAVLMYAGFRGVNPIEALRDVASGKPAGVEKRSANLTAVSSTRQVAYSSTGPGLSALVGAVSEFAGDKYSQARRWQVGYSDCSSFVGKGLKELGIKPPGLSTTWDYLRSSEWRAIPRSEASGGDLAVTGAHMAVFTDVSHGIGQQSPRRNVQTGPMSELMYPQAGSYTVLRYVGAGRRSGGGVVSA